MSHAHKEEHTEHDHPARQTRPSQGRTILPSAIAAVTRTLRGRSMLIPICGRVRWSRSSWERTPVRDRIARMRGVRRELTVAHSLRK